MKPDPLIHHRQSIRLKGYDYSTPGAYFVTICVQNRKCVLGEIVAGQMRLNAIGVMAQTEWRNLPQRFPGIILDAHIFMPNHMHGIIVWAGPDPALEGASVRAGLVPAPEEADPTSEAPATTLEGASTRDAPTESASAVLGDIIGAFKSITTHQCILGVRQLGWPPFPGKFWQRNYYEHIVRTEADLARIRAYILNNPAKWAWDQLHPAAPPNPFNREQS
jgi:putative transposase